MKDPFRTAFAASLGWRTGKALMAILFILLILILGLLIQ